MERREFLSSFFPRMNNSEQKCQLKDVIEIGHLSSHPVNSGVELSLANEAYHLSSMAEGLRLTKINENKNIRLTINEHGQVQAHLKEEWPEKAVLSILTGEMYII